MNLYFFCVKGKETTMAFFSPHKLCLRDILLCLTIYIKDVTSLHLLLSFDCSDSTRCTESRDKSQEFMFDFGSSLFSEERRLFREKHDDTFTMIQPRNCFSNTTLPVTACSNQNNKTKKVRKRIQYKRLFPLTSHSFDVFFAFDGKEGNRFCLFPEGF